MKSSRCPALLAVVMVFCLLAPSGLSGDENIMRENEELRRIIAALSGRVERVPASEKLVSVSFVDAELRSVISLLAEKHEINVFGGEGISGRVTARLEDVPLEVIFEMFLEANGYGLVRRGEDFYEIVTRDLIDRERLERSIAAFEFKSFYVNYADLEAVENLINRMGILDDNARVFLCNETSQILIRGDGKQLREVERLLRDIDVQPPQILIRARVVEINKDMMDSLGIEWTADFIAGEYRLPEVEGRTRAARLPQDPTFKFGLTHPRFDIEATIEALVYRQIARVLTAPRLTTVNNVEATLTVADQVPVVTREQTINEEGNVIFTTESVEFEEVGLVLRILPKKVGGNRVNLKINPSITQVTSFTDTDPPQPVIDTRETVTEVILRHDQWLVIGGLVKTNMSEIRRKIPLLGDIPLIGLAFSSRSEREETSELLILVNAQLLDDELIGADTRDSLLRQDAIKSGGDKTGDYGR